MSRIYDGIWGNGQSTNLNPGHHYNQQYNQRARSIRVHKGEKVTLYNNADRSGRKSYVFYEGMYSDLSFYGAPFVPGMIHVEKTDLKWNDFAEVGWYKWYAHERYYYVYHKLPVGDWFAPEYFWENRVDHLKLPFGVTAEVFEHKEKDNSLIFDGIQEKGVTVVNLEDYDYNQKSSRIKVTADEWRSSGVHLENEKFIDGGEWEAETLHISDESDIATVGGEITIAAEVQDTTEISWNIYAEITASAQFQFGPETCQGTVGIEATIGGGYGENESHSVSRSVERTVHVETTGEGNVVATLMVRQGIMEARYCSYVDKRTDRCDNRNERSYTSRKSWRDTYFS